MAQLNFFDASQVSPQDNFTPLPAGEYLVMVIDSEVKVTKDGTGSYLATTMQVMDGPFKGRMVWDNIQMQNKNPTTVEIGQRQLSGLCHAVGVLQLRDSVQLHNILMIVKLIIKDDPSYGPKNVCRGYKAANQAANTPQPPMAGGYPQQQDPAFVPPQQQAQQPPMGYPQQQAPAFAPQIPPMGGYPQQQAPVQHQQAPAAAHVVAPWVKR